MHKFSQRTRPGPVILQLLPQSKCLIWIFKLVIWEIAWEGRRGDGQGGQERLSQYLLVKWKGWWQHGTIIPYSLWHPRNRQTQINLFSLSSNSNKKCVTTYTNTFFCQPSQCASFQCDVQVQLRTHLIATCKTFTSLAKRYFGKHQTNW